MFRTSIIAVKGRSSFCEYRTRRLVLEAWEALEEPGRVGKPIAAKQDQGAQP